jgi:stage II sporulation protein D
MRHLGVITLSLFLAACGASITPLPANHPSAVTPVRAKPTTASAPGRSESGRPELGSPLPASPDANVTLEVAEQPAGANWQGETDQPVRVALATQQSSARISATGNWSLYDRTGENLLARSSERDVWTVTGDDGMLRAVRDNGRGTTPFHGPLVARPTEEGSFITFNGKRYRGEMLVMLSGSGLTVINRLSVESYLRGVVPLEIGTDRTRTEEAAVEAQVIAARSYTYTRLDDRRPYDLTATVTDQVYGGIDAERAVSDMAIAATRDMVLLYNRHVINAPYHSNSGGVTAAASEVWRTNDAPYLVSVSDRIPGTDHFYCEQSPKFRWSRTYDAASLSAVLDRYLEKYAGAPDGPLGAVRGIRETGRTGSGRVAGLVFETDRGRYTVRGNDVRFVLRTAGGDILPSTLFTFDVSTDGSGRITRLTINGTGNGHGVGMDQWGAIARSRAGQDYRTILRTYYPGTIVGRVI